MISRRLPEISLFSLILFERLSVENGCHFLPTIPPREHWFCTGRSVTECVSPSSEQPQDGSGLSEKMGRKGGQQTGQRFAYMAWKRQAKGRLSFQMRPGSLRNSLFSLHFQFSCTSMPLKNVCSQYTHTNAFPFTAHQYHPRLIPQSNVRAQHFCNYTQNAFAQPISTCQNQTLLLQEFLDLYQLEMILSSSCYNLISPSLVPLSCLCA